MGARVSPPSQPYAPMLFADEPGAVEPLGELMLLTIAGQRIVMTRHNLLAMMEAGRRAIMKQAADAATVHNLMPPARSPRRRSPAQQQEGR